jgi:hypothetical protein
MRAMSRRLAVPLAGAVLAASAALPARADVSDAQAAQLEARVHAWLADLLGPRAHITDRPVRLTAEGDHFAVSVPVADLLGNAGLDVSAEPLTAIARPLAGGRWALDNIQLPSPLRLAVTVPGQGPSTMTFSADAQDQHAMLDPSLATVSSLDQTLRGYASRDEGAKGTQVTRMETLTSHMAWQPAEAGRVNMLQDFQGSLLTFNGLAPDGGRLSMSAERMHGTLRMDQVATDRLKPILHALVELIPVVAAAAADAAAAKSDKAPAPVDMGHALKHGADLLPDIRPALRQAVLAARDLTSGVGEQVTLDNLRVEAAGHSGHAARMAAGMAMDAPGGLLALRLNFTLDGLDSPEIPPGVYRDYLPRHILLSPRVAGVSAADLSDLLLQAIDGDSDDKVLQARAEAMLRKSPISFGLEDMALDLGPVTLTGAGTVQVVSRDSYTGEAHLAMTGMDALFRQANATPELQQAVPVLIMLKGLAQQDGEKLVWNITYQDAKLLVNGNDLSQMMPGK